MVNVRFPERRGYGFEMVDAPAQSLAFAESQHQSKIYTESNHPDFP
jgi:hypothetical protein